MIPFYHIFVRGYYQDKNEQEKSILIELIPSCIGNGDGEAGFSEEELNKVVGQLKLSKQEKESLLNYFYDNYATSIDEYYYGEVEKFQQYISIPVSKEVVR